MSVDQANQSNLIWKISGALSAMIIVAAVATPIAKSQRMREIWSYVMSSGVILKAVVMELARIIQFI